MNKKNVLQICFVFISGLLAAEEALTVDFFVRGADSNASTAEDHPLLMELDKITKAKTHFIWASDPEFSDTLALQIANDTLPMIVASDKNALMLKGIAEGKFWDIGPYLKDYPNLAKINPIIIENSKVNGKLYGLPKIRPLGRNAFIYRQDWFDRLGLTSLKTIEDFKNMLEQFTYNDPDGNGLDDTYGMTLTSYRGSFEEIAVWFGAPNSWGLNSMGDLQPSFMTEEYRDSLIFLRDAYSEGLINRDFAIFNPNYWNDEIIQGRSGVIVDITDRTRGILKSSKAENKDIIMNIQGAVEGSLGYRVLATNGFAGLIFFSKSGITSETMLKQVLSYINELNSDSARDLLLLGIEGKDWVKTENGTEDLSYENKISVGGDIAQTLIYPTAPSSLTAVIASGEKIRSGSEVQLDNENYLVPNRAIGYTSNIQSQRGGFLQELIDDARIRYIMGLVDDSGYNQIIEKWKEYGGDVLISEINEAYHSSQ